MENTKKILFAVLTLGIIAVPPLASTIYPNKDKEVNSKMNVIERTDLNKIKDLNSPIAISAADPAKTSKKQIETVMNNIVQEKIKDISPLAKIKKDFTFDISENKDMLDTRTFNLTTKGNEIFIKIKAVNNSHILKGETAAIAVKTPQAKINLQTTTIDLSGEKIIKTVTNKNIVTEQEIRNLISPLILKKLQATYNVINEGKDQDYTYNIYKDVARKTEYAPTQISSDKATTLYLKIIANSKRPLIAGINNKTQVDIKTTPGK